MNGQAYKTNINLSMRLFLHYHIDQTYNKKLD